jgi:hypothetical protein
MRAERKAKRREPRQKPGTKVRAPKALIGPIRLTLPMLIRLIRLIGPMLISLIGLILISLIRPIGLIGTIAPGLLVGNNLRDNHADRRLSRKVTNYFANK